jgi:hypothetical protein
VRPQLGCGVLGETEGAEGDVDQVGQDRTEEEEPNVDLRVAEDPADQPERRAEVPEDHSGDEDPAAVDTPRQLLGERLLALRR